MKISNYVSFSKIHCLVSILISISHGELMIKPSEPIVLRDQFKSFIASCTGLLNARVGP